MYFLPSPSIQLILCVQFSFLRVTPLREGFHCMGTTEIKSIMCQYLNKSIDFLWTFSWKCIAGVPPSQNLQNMTNIINYLISLSYYAIWCNTLRGKWNIGIGFYRFIYIHLLSSVQSLSRVRLFATPWIAARQVSLPITDSQNSLKLASIESVMPSSHLILCRPLLRLPPIPPSIRVFSNELTLRMKWTNYWSFSFSTISSKEHPDLL